MLIGPAPFVKKAMHLRKMFGGGMRQAGILTSAARVALTEHFHKLNYTHELAQWLAQEAKKLGANIPIPVDTSMVRAMMQVRRRRTLIEHLTRCTSTLSHLALPRSSFD
jgi:threonine aldolase